MIYILFFLLLTYYILTHSDISLYYAFSGLSLWYHKMVPSLLPFMILSGTLIRMNLTEKFALVIHPLTKRIFRCNPNVSYGILMGFLCGFPMGAKVTGELLRQGKITDSEADFLLAFNNNIGPVYFCTFVIPTLQIQNVALALGGMYGIPLLYGIFLRYTVFRGALDNVFKQKDSILAKAEMEKADLLTSLDEAIRSGISSISMLCGYMIIFNLLNILPHYFLPHVHKWIAPVLEITGGIMISQPLSPIYILILLPFGGLSCIAQTNSILRGTSLSIRKYTLHKLIITALTAVFYGAYLCIY